MGQSQFFLLVFHQGFFFSPSHGRFVPHALHVVKVSRLGWGTIWENLSSHGPWTDFSGLMRVWLLAKEQGLLEGCLRNQS
jgi:hypothetical protein